MNRAKLIRETLTLTIGLFVAFQLGRSILDSIEAQIFLYRKSSALKATQAQLEQVNQELRDGLSNYRSTRGLEALARERLNVAGDGEILIRLSK